MYTTKILEIPSKHAEDTPSPTMHDYDVMDTDSSAVIPKTAKTVVLFTHGGAHTCRRQLPGVFPLSPAPLLGLASWPPTALPPQPDGQHALEVQDVQLLALFLLPYLVHSAVHTWVVGVMGKVPNSLLCTEVLFLSNLC